MDVKQENPPDKAGRDLEAMLAITADEATRVLLSPSWRCSFLRRRVQMNDICVCADTRQLGLQRRIPCRPLEAKRTVDWHRFNVWKNTKGFGPSCSCSPESHGQALLEDFQTASVHPPTSSCRIEPRRLLRFSWQEISCFLRAWAATKASSQYAKVCRTHNLSGTSTFLI
jgi:hypothetical protein